jgi:hypothetical protein
METNNNRTYNRNGNRNEINNFGICDSNYYRYIGHQENNNDSVKEFFSPRTLDIISKKITQLLIGVHPQNRPIIVPVKGICNIMSSVYQNYRPSTGDIYSRYIIPQVPQNYVQTMIDQVIEIITSHIRADYGIREHNAKLTKWTTVLGDFNVHGLRQHSKIKVLEKRPNPMSFNMMY